MNKVTDLFSADESQTSRFTAPEGTAIDIKVRSGDPEVADKWIAAIQQAHDLSERVPAPPSRLERDLANTTDLLYAFCYCAWAALGAACGAILLSVGDPSRTVETIKGLGAAFACSLIVAATIALVNAAIREHRERAWRPVSGDAA